MAAAIASLSHHYVNDFVRVSCFAFSISLLEVFSKGSWPGVVNQEGLNSFDSDDLAS